MLEILVWSVFVGSLGIEAVVAGGLLRWRQEVVGKQHQEEEENLTIYQPTNKITPVETPPPSFLPASGTGEQLSAIASVHSQSNGAAVQQPHPPYQGDWEFKIVRASYDLFRDAAIFQRLCEEEAKAGWILLEKLDDRRIRFKRPVALRDILNPEAISFDPYRCHYGPSSNWMNLLGAIAALSAMVLPAYLGFSLVSSTLGKSSTISPAAPPLQDFPPSAPKLPTIP